MLKYVTMNKDMTIMIPDSDVVKRVINMYKGYYDDYIEPMNRYVWLYRSVYKCVKEIESE